MISLFSSAFLELHASVSAPPCLFLVGALMLCIFLAFAECRENASLGTLSTDEVLPEQMEQHTFDGDINERNGSLGMSLR